MSKTLENLTKAFIGESQARNRYTIYSKQATKEGFHEIAEIFLKTADNEREHAKWLFRLINQIKENDDPVIVEADANTILGDTATNLRSAIEGEHYEANTMYPEFAEIAKEEGFNEIAIRLENIGKAEVHHENRYKNLLKNVEDGTILLKDTKVTWECRKCGFSVEGTKPPAKCPSCDHPEEYFEIICEKY
ncbi:rubrerythrin-1 [Methanobrevibacter filiformis]|uniref:Rubrerythrin-1 n=1 Tax=Methanobrevibacter filiformis TaxID=55758 RepID=A0A166BLH7_9EURY|nr:rubrerythrin family protein [Methanobrevibacter filiformis]KZX13526.1 rubrerythrin-1 [Methanobrevibacter filiformis]